MFSERTPASVPAASATVVVHSRGPLWPDVVLERIASFVESGPYRRVALQMPDSLLPHAVATCQAIEAILSSRATTLLTPNSVAKLFVLADTTFGSCCPDEVTAQHYASDCIVHFGTACMSRSCRLPVHYVHSSSGSSSSLSSESRGLLSAVEFFAREAATAHKKVEVVVVPAPGVTLPSALGIASELSSVKVTIASLDDIVSASSSDESCHVWRVNGAHFRSIDRTAYDAQCFVLLVPRLHDSPATSRGSSGGTVDSLGLDGPAVHSTFPQLAQLHMIQSFNTATNPEGGSDDDDAWVAARNTVIVAPVEEDGRVEAYLTDHCHSSRIGRQVLARQRQRSHHVEVVRASDSIGIIVASLAIRGYYETTFALRDAIRAVGGKRCYVLYIGHINEFKVANFVETVDCFCVIACPNSRVAHFATKADNFMKPMVEPSEILEALGLADATSACCYTTDFTAVLPHLVREGKPTPERVRAVSDDAGDGVRGELVCRPSGQSVSIAGAAGALLKLSEKTYLGLEPRVGQTPVQEAIAQGRSGIARGYETEQEGQQV